MPYPTPSFNQLQSQIIADILASGQVPNGLLPVSNLRILSYVIANQAYDHTEFLRYILQQAVPFTATDEYLDAWAALKGINRYPATAASTTLTFTGTSGTSIPLGTQARRTDGVIFATTSAATIGSGGTVTVAATATTTGSTTNTASGVALTLANSLTGVSTSVTLATAATGGADPETDADLRTRMLTAFQSVGSSGSTSNYVAWASAVSGVTRVWILPWGMGPGTIVVYVMLDTTEAGNNGFPLGTNGLATGETRFGPTATGDQLTVANALYSVQPVTDLVYVASPIPQHITVNIGSLSVAVTSTITSAVLASLQSLLLANGSPLGCTIYVSQIESAIQSAVGASTTFSLISPASNITTIQGYLPVITSADLTIT